MWTLRKSRETNWKLSKYGDGGEWEKLVEDKRYNGGSDEKKRPDRILVIPDRTLDILDDAVEGKE